MNADQILKQHQLSQIDANYTSPFGKSERVASETKPAAPVGRFFELLQRDFTHINNHDYEKYRKIIITAEPFHALGLDDDAILLRLLYVMQKDRRAGLCALALRCIQEASEDSGTGVIAFSNPISLTRNYTTSEDVITAFRAGPVEMDYLRDRMTQSRQNYRFVQASYQQIDLDRDGMTHFCDKHSTYIYLPDNFNKELMEEVIKPRLFQDN